MRRRYTVLALLITIGMALIATPVVAYDSTPNMPERMVLGNGLTVVLAPIVGSGQVAVVSMYRAGLMDEPEGMPMVSALAGRLLHMGATKSYKAGEIAELIAGKGVTGGETMQAFSHCDYTVPSAGLELALKVEGERISSLEITQELIDSQLALCHDEFIGLDKNPQTGQYKAACSALAQAWRYGATAVSMLPLQKSATLAKVEEYYRSCFQPSVTAVVLIGDFDRQKAHSLVRKYLGSIPSRKIVPAKPVQWDDLPNMIDAKWDSGIRALCIGFRPTGSETDQYLLQIVGGLLSEALATDEKIAELADCVVCADPVQTLNDLPFYIYATPKEGVSVDDLRKALESSLQAILANPETEAAVAQAIAIAQQTGNNPVPTYDELAAMIDQMFPDADKEAMIGMMMGQIALQFGYEELLTRGKPGCLSVPDGTPPDAVLAHIKGMLDPSREFVTVLTPLLTDSETPANQSVRHNTGLKGFKVEALKK